MGETWKGEGQGEIVGDGFCPTFAYSCESTEEEGRNAKSFAGPESI